MMLAVVLAAGACGGGGDGEGREGLPPSAETGERPAGDTVQKDNTGPAGAHTGG